LKKELRAEGFQNATEIAGIAGDAAFEIFNNRLEAESQSLEIQKQKQLALAGDDGTKKKLLKNDLQRSKTN
jgi:hypothetical protein